MRTTTLPGAILLALLAGLVLAPTSEARVGNLQRVEKRAYWEADRLCHNRFIPYGIMGWKPDYRYPDPCGGQGERSENPYSPPWHGPYELDCFKVFHHRTGRLIYKARCDVLVAYIVYTVEEDLFLNGCEYKTAFGINSKGRLLATDVQWAEGHRIHTTRLAHRTFACGGNPPLHGGNDPPRGRWRE